MVDSDATANPGEPSCFHSHLNAIFSMLLATPVVVLAQGSTVAMSGYVAVHGLKIDYRIQGASWLVEIRGSPGELSARTAYHR